MSYADNKDLSDARKLAVFGIIKAAMGFRGFSLRAKEKVSGEWTLVCLAYNLKGVWCQNSADASGALVMRPVQGLPGRVSLAGCLERFSK